MQTISFLKGLGLGLAAMYFLDPQHGRRRRLRVMNGIENGLRDLSHDLSGRGQELAQRAKHAVQEKVAEMRHPSQSANPTLGE
jgi:hypothetical protein